MIKLSNSVNCGHKNYAFGVVVISGFVPHYSFACPMEISIKMDVTTESAIFKLPISPYSDAMKLLQKSFREKTLE